MVFWVAFDLDGTIGSFDSIMPYLGFFFPESFEQIFKAPHWQGEAFPSIVPSAKVKPKLRRAFREFVRIMAEYESKVKMLRPGITTLIETLLNARRAGKIGGIMVYSNNSNPYCLLYAHELLKRVMKTDDDIFCPLVHWWHPLRNSELRVGYDPPLQLGYGPKRFQTIVAAFEKEIRCGYYTPSIRHESITPERVIFLDDQIHPDIKAQLPASNYIHVQPYGRAVNVDFIIDAFLNAFESQSLDYNSDYLEQFKPMNLDFGSGEKVVESLKRVFVKADVSEVTDIELIRARVEAVINRNASLVSLKEKLKTGTAVTAAVKTRGGSRRGSKTRRVKKGKGLRLYIEI